MKTIFSKNAPQPVGPYSQAIESNGFVFLSGQVGIDPKTSKIESKTIEGQTEQVIQNIKEVLKASNIYLKNVVSANCFLSDISNYQKFNEAYGKHFKNIKPARTTVEVSKLPLNALIEISVIACKKS